MNDISTPYRHHEFYTPTIPPFDTNGPLLWPTLVGTFLRPIIESADMVYWFCNHGSDFQFCFAHQDYKKIEEKIEDQKRNFKTSSKVLPKENMTIGMEFRGKRWISEGKKGIESLEARRSQLVLNFLHSISALYFDGLVQEGLYWKPERNDDTTQNPEGSGFESLLHLLCNITQVPTIIYDFELGGQRGLQTSIVISHLSHMARLQPTLHRKIPVQF